MVFHNRQHLIFALDAFSALKQTDLTNGRPYYKRLIGRACNDFAIGALSISLALKKRLSSPFYVPISLFRVVIVVICHYSVGGDRSNAGSGTELVFSNFLIN